jgi:hypothetical protein
MSSKISKAFNKFAGREVNVTQSLQEIAGMKYYASRLDPNDPVIEEIKTFALKKGFNSVRVWLPDTYGTADFAEDRLNVKVAEEKDGKFRVVKDGFHAG